MAGRASVAGRVLAAMSDHPFAAEPPMGAALPAEARAVSGLDQLKRQIAGEWSPPPIHFMTGLLVRSAAEGEATFTTPVTDWWRAEFGTDWASLAAFAIDAPLGVAVLTALGPGHTTPTAELSVTYVQDPAPTDCVEATASLVMTDGDTGISRGEVRSGAGTLIALATTRVFDVRLPLPDAEPDGNPAPTETRDRTPVYQRRPPTSDGTPIDWLLGIAASPQADRVSFSVQVSGWVSSPAGTAYGGYIAAVAQRAAVLASQTTGNGRIGRPLDLKVNFFRPVPPQPLVLRGEAQMLRSGRRAGLAEVRLTGPGGAPVAHALSTLRSAEG